MQAAVKCICYSQKDGAPSRGLNLPFSSVACLYDCLLRLSVVFLWLKRKLSLDLTPKQADDLSASYIEEMQRLHENAIQMGALEAKTTEEFSEGESKLRQAVKILEL